VYQSRQAMLSAPDETGHVTHHCGDSVSVQAGDAVCT